MTSCYIGHILKFWFWSCIFLVLLYGLLFYCCLSVFVYLSVHIIVIEKLFIGEINIWTLLLTSINHFAIFVHICKFNCVVLDLCPLSFDYLHPYILRTVQIGKWRWPLRTVTWKIEMFINLFSVFFLAQ